jgi:hypothetical protein
MGLGIKERRTGICPNFCFNLVSLNCEEFVRNLRSSGIYAALSGSSVLMFRANLSVPSLRVEGTS